MTDREREIFSLVKERGPCSAAAACAKGNGGSPSFDGAEALRVLRQRGYIERYRVSNTYHYQVVPPERGFRGMV